MNNQKINLETSTLNKLKKFANKAVSDNDINYIQEEINFYYSNNISSPVIQEIEQIIYWKSIFCKN